MSLCPFSSCLRLLQVVVMEAERNQSAAQAALSQAQDARAKLVAEDAANMTAAQVLVSHPHCKKSHNIQQRTMHQQIAISVDFKGSGLRFKRRRSRSTPPATRRQRRRQRRQRRHSAWARRRRAKRTQRGRWTRWHGRWRGRWHSSSTSPTPRRRLRWEARRTIGDARCSRRSISGGLLVDQCFLEFS